MAHILKNEKANFTLVKDGVEAVGAMDDFNFDAVLLDINMPNLTGEELVYHKENYEKRNSKTPFLALTANSSKEDIEGYYKIGFSGFIPKPYISTQFVGILYKVLKEVKKLRHIILSLIFKFSKNKIQHTFSISIVNIHLRN